MGNKYSKLGKNTLIFAIGTIGSKGIHFLLIPFYTRIFNSYQYGQLDIIQTSINLLIPLITLQLGEAIFRFTMDKNGDRKSVLTNALIYNFGLILLLIIILIINKSLVLFNVSFYLVISIIIGEMLLIQFKHFIRAIGQIYTFVITDIIQVIMFLLFNLVFLVILSMSIEGYFLALALSKIVALVFLVIKCNIFNYIEFKYIDEALIKKMLLYSIPLIPNTLMWWVMNASDRYIISYFLGFESTGIYAISYKLPSLLVLMYGVFAYAWQIFAIEESEAADKNESYATIFLYNRIFFIISISLLLPFLKSFITILGSKEFYDSWKYIPILLFATMFSAFSKFYGTGYIISKKTGGAFTTSLYGGIINIVVGILIIPYLGLFGASLSTMIGFLVMWLFRMRQTKKFFYIRIEWLSFISSLTILIIQSLLLFVNMHSFFSSLLHLLLFSLVVIINKKPLKRIFLFFLTKIRMNGSNKTLK
ncbi:oligosaccharide flippase family protein [Halobacillus yeomjeoni]|uniref:lipopolysaccharide biosynthesis protein n=1 Tax=Halobacillus yeomjeoni TaxID=311194 RepID=UPI001CD4795A|nr:oligosaccharide flippase family protein [Halobacillus yeomjeoni]MCA0985180.1 oligosaccharide flippase family protein [Halobacillus yeomjeoni]